MASRGRIGVVTASAVAVALIATAAAIAALDYSENEYPLANNSQMSDYAGCGDKTDPIGGGVYLSGSTLGTEVNFTYPSDSSSDANQRPDGWEAGGNSDAGGDQAFIDYVICTDQSLSYASTQKPLPLDTDRSALAECPGNAHVASGGVYITDPGDLQREVVETYPVDDGDPGSEPDDGWAGRASNYGSAGPTKLQVFAVCASKALSYRSRTRGLPAESQRGDSSNCPNGTRVVGGGMEITKPGNATESATVAPFDGDDSDNKADDGWNSWGNNESGKDRRMTTWAVCQ